MGVVSYTGLVVAVTALVLSTTGCTSTLETFTCARDVDCQSEGTEGFCEDSKVCSFLDFSCATGRRYGKLAGDPSNDCVDPDSLDASPIDATTVVVVDADLGPDATVIGPADADPPDAATTCPNSDDGLFCVDLTTCPSNNSNCCSYSTVGDNTTCNDVCIGIGLTCDGAAAPEGICNPGADRTCSFKAEGTVCACIVLPGTN